MGKYSAISTAVPSAAREILFAHVPLHPDALDLAAVVDGQHAVRAQVGNGRMEEILDERFRVRLKKRESRRADVRFHRAGRQPGLDALRLFRAGHRHFQRRRARTGRLGDPIVHRAGVAEIMNHFQRHAGDRAEREGFLPRANRPVRPGR